MKFNLFEFTIFRKKYKIRISSINALKLTFADTPYSKEQASGLELTDGMFWGLALTGLWLFTLFETLPSLDK